MFTIEYEPKSKKPTHTVYHVKAIEGTDQTEWKKIGVAWEHADKQGLNFGIQGNNLILTIRKNKPKAE